MQDTTTLLLLALRPNPTCTSLDVWDIDSGPPVINHFILKPSPVDTTEPFTTHAS
jgi:hypothetical protein